MKNHSDKLPPRGYSIGDLGKRTGVKVVTIRYYEKIGMLQDPPRSEGGQRAYEHNHLRRLSFIKRSRELGFSLAEIKALLQLEHTEETSCDDVKALTLEHINDIRNKIADLKRMESLLEDMAAQCDQGAISGCPILDALAATEVV